MNPLIPALRSASALLAALAWTGLVLATAPAAATPTGPQLSIAMDDGHATANAKDTLRYTVTVTNLGTKAVSGLRLAQAVPTGARFVSADAGGHHQADTISWVVRVPPAGKVTLHSALAVADRTPKDLLRLATVVCVRVTTKGPPLICATDSDQLPTGAAAEAAAARAAAPTGLWARLRSHVVAVGATAVGLALLAAFLIHRRRPTQGLG